MVKLVIAMLSASGYNEAVAVLKNKNNSQIRTNENKDSAMTKAKRFFDKFFE